MAAIGKAKLKRINFTIVLIKVNTSLKPQGFVMLLSLSRSVPHFTRPPFPTSEPEPVLVPAPVPGAELLGVGVVVVDAKSLQTPSTKICGSMQIVGIVIGAGSLQALSTKICGAIQTGGVVVNVESSQTPLTKICGAMQIGGT